MAAWVLAQAAHAAELCGAAGAATVHIKGLGGSSGRHRYVPGTGTVLSCMHTATVVPLFVRHWHGVVTNMPCAWLLVKVSAIGALVV